MKVLEDILKFESSELCYINTDSIHVSINRNEKSHFLRHINDYIGKDMGKLKIECCADKGYWFDVGRYWLCSQNKVLQYKNISFNSVSSTTPFVSYTKVTELKRNSFITTYKSTPRYLKKNFSYTKKLDVTTFRFCRYDYDDIADDFIASNSILEESFYTNEDKFKLYKKIADDYTT